MKACILAKPASHPREPAKKSLWAIPVAQSIAVLMFFPACPAFALSETHECERRLAIERVQSIALELRAQQTAEPPVSDFYDDYGFLLEGRRLMSQARVDSRYSEEFKTRFYFASTAEALPDGSIPWIDPKARGLFIFFHGSGTMKSSGKNYMEQQNELANLGYASLSFDLPFHAEGPEDERFFEVDYFMDWVKRIIQKHRVPGQPVYVIGHSFGPDVSAELISRDPFLVDGAVLLSPASFNPTLDKWQRQKTSRMRFGGDVLSNEIAGEWAQSVSDQMLWKRRRSSPETDPTLINPKLRVRVLSGNLEEYVPAPLGGPDHLPIAPNTYDICKALKAFFARIHCTIEKGVGHYIFQYEDDQGFGVVTREMLAVDGKTPAERPALLQEAGHRYSTMDAHDQLALRYSQDRLFRKWLDERIGNENVLGLIIREKTAAASTYLAEYQTLHKKRHLSIRQNILSTEKWAPDFFAQIQARVANPTNAEWNSVTARYFDFLSMAPKGLRDWFARSTPAELEKIKL